MTDDVNNRKKGIHVGLIPDGNRRFAVENGMPLFNGHREGAKKIEEFLSWCSEYPQIKMLSIFALSTENLKRPREEVDVLWDVYRDELKRLLGE